MLVLKLRPAMLALFTVTVLGASSAQAQFADLLRNVRNLGDLAKTATDTVGALKSVADVSSGVVNPGVAAADADGKVVLYTTSWCGYCKRALAHVRSNSIPYVEKDIESNAANKAEYTKLGGKGGVPFIVMGTQTLVGFSAEQFNAKYAVFQKEAPKPMTAQAPAVNANASAQPAAVPQPAATANAWQVGDTLFGKINGVKVYTQPAKTGVEMTTLSKTDEVVFLGEEQAGLIKIASSKGDGWVDKLLLKKQ
jgi:glutaredoxin